MKKLIVLFSITLLLVASTAFINRFNDDGDKPTPIPSSKQRAGDSAKGYNYLITGDFLKSGVPYAAFTLMMGKDKTNYLQRTGKNANVGHDYNVVTTADGVDIVIPTCLQCHAQVFNDSLYVGLGNSLMDFTDVESKKGMATNAGVKAMQVFSPKQYNAAKAMLKSFELIYPKLETQVRGVNSADRLAAVLVAHRNPETLIWSDEPLLTIPDDAIPTDVPAWWMMKKKNAMFYNGFGRGDFGRFLMLSNILTVKDTAEAAEVYTHFGDVLAFIKSIKAPKYPYPVNNEYVKEGETIFMDNCSKCHGTYGANETYPNLLVPENIIQTDSMLFKANYQNPQFIEWFNKSWFAKGEFAARLEPSSGYVAPPLDGVWITAPYLHNGSVPTLEAVLNSKIRPTYWSRSFDNKDYNYANPGWNYKVETGPNGKKNYNTTLPGYGNYGHYFGDKLSNDERKKLIEYLKTL